MQVPLEQYPQPPAAWVLLAISALTKKKKKKKKGLVKLLRASVRCVHLRGAYFATAV
jgi:hypothetical protein